ncbi:enhanced serine sensitivity protein SseB C-terminal domain-containing protein, partial [Salmonella enterica]
AIKEHADAQPNLLIGIEADGDIEEIIHAAGNVVDSLTTLFKTIKPVKRAFLCAIKEHADAQPNLLIGIEADGDIEEIIHAAGNV